MILKIKNTSWQNFFSNILNTNTLWLRHPVCLLPLSCFQLLYDSLFLFICRSYTNYTYFRFVFKLLHMVLSGVVSSNCTKVFHFHLVNYIYFTISKLPMCNMKILKFSMVVLIFIIFLQMYQSYLLLYYFSLILNYEFSISMWTSWYSKTNILSTYFVLILCFIWELRLYLISTKFSIKFFFFINLHDINKSKFFVIMHLYIQLCFVSCHQ